MTAQCIDVPADEVDAFISEKMTDDAGDYVDMQRLFEICDNKPMIGGRSLRAHGRDEPRRRRGRLRGLLPRPRVGAFLCLPRQEGADEVARTSPLPDEGFYGKLRTRLPQLIVVVQLV